MYDLATTVNRWTTLVQEMHLSSVLGVPAPFADKCRFCPFWAGHKTP